MLTRDSQRLFYYKHFCRITRMKQPSEIKMITALPNYSKIRLFLQTFYTYPSFQFDIMASLNFVVARAQEMPDFVKFLCYCKAVLRISGHWSRIDHALRANKCRCGLYVGNGET